MGDRVTEGDNPIEYEETTETFEGGTRTTKTHRMPDSKDSQDPKPPDDPPEPSGTPTLAAATGMGLDAPPVDGKKDKKPPKTES